MAHMLRMAEVSLPTFLLTFLLRMNPKERDVYGRLIARCRA
jgi:hypothetical protein